MKYNPDIHKRKSTRLQNYDYSQAGVYFITICTQNRECLFGKIVDGVMILNVAGLMVQEIWKDLPKHYPHIEIDTSIIMPNHLHSLLFITEVSNDKEGESRGEPCVRPKTTAGTTPDTVGRIIQEFKSKSTTQYIKGVKENGWPPFSGKLWQRGYYDHIVRNEANLEKIRDYINNNPLQWELDKENPNYFNNI